MSAWPTSINRKTAAARLRVLIHGAVQGVGFRPFVYRLATEMNLCGWVSNSPQGVKIEVDGEPDQLRAFLVRVESERPAISFIQSLESSYLDAVGYTLFEIRESETGGAKTAIVLPDIATCPDCERDIFDPSDRRYQYPFTNCTNCGPRYSIVLELPYDRPNTTMHRFTMCAKCQAEYDDPLDRRFHAQPNACPACGPHLDLWDAGGDTLASGHEALLVAAAALREGKIIAVKGLGGFHLMVRAGDDNAVKTLRLRKHRAEKPLALMMPGIAEVERECEVSDLERRLLLSPERPIVLLKTKAHGGAVSQLVATGNPYLGCMLPYTPLHLLLMHELGFAVVATSGNLADEPICIDEHEALIRLKGIADLFLIHDRPIVRHVDDSIVRVMAGREMVVRRARGFAPLPLPVKVGNETILAVGAHLKNSVALSAGGQAFVSQHIGDLETPQAVGAFREVIDSLEGLYQISPALVACDKHPDYMSSRYSSDLALPSVAVQHHYAHVLSCMAENELEGPVLGVAWDGTGLGDDGTIWGGEFLRVDDAGFTRSAHFRTFPLPGGDKAAREPRRVALGALYEDIGDVIFHITDTDPMRSFDLAERKLIRKMLLAKINSPVTSSVGRLFDAVASIIGLRQFAGFEGQAAMELEFAIGGLHTDESYDFGLSLDSGGPAVVDWGSALSDIITDVQFGVSRALISARFHNMLAETIVRVADHVGEPAVVLSGGCFQNKYLLERSIDRLRGAGFRPYWHQRVPTNDGGISLGQTLAAIRHIDARTIEAPTNERRTAICV